jgi:hypothetical protein
VALWIVALLLSSSAWAVAGTCTPGPTTLCLLANRFQVEIDWEDFEAQTGTGQVLPFASDDTGFFWFADPLLVDNYVKIFDGTAINGFFWVLFGSLTNVEYTLTVTDTALGTQAIYVNPLGSFTSVVDTEAIEDVPLPVTAAPRSPAPRSSRTRDVTRAAVSPLQGSGGSCVPSATVLCLDEGRFSVEVLWDAGTGSGSGQAVQLTDNSGYYWFFTPSSTEMAVKVQNGDNGFFWIFYAATTDVGYTITVTDTCNGAVQSYFNPQGNLTSAGDFMAFPAGNDCGIFSDGFESGDISGW